MVVIAEREPFGTVFAPHLIEPRRELVELRTAFGRHHCEAAVALRGELVR